MIHTKVSPGRLWFFPSSISGAIRLSLITSFLLSLLMTLIHLMSTINRDALPAPEHPPLDDLVPDFFFLRFGLDGFLFTFLAGFGLLVINLIPQKEYSFGTRSFYVSLGERIAISFLFVVLFQWFHFLFFELVFKPPFEIGFNGLLITKNLSLLTIAVLFGELLRLLGEQQKQRLELERIKKENLETRYNAMAAQINPHFFFNSLNSLSALVREGDKEPALKYIDGLSGIFRYVLQSSQKGLVPLTEEIEFFNAYRYLLGIRFEGKLFFDIDINDQPIYYLPVLSLQLLIENVIKHNMVSRSSPLTICIRIEDDSLVVSNPIRPKLGKAEPESGFGLANLARRVKILTGQSLCYSGIKGAFVVKVPMLKTSQS